MPEPLSDEQLAPRWYVDDGIIHWGPIDEGCLALDPWTIFGRTEVYEALSVDPYSALVALIEEVEGLRASERRLRDALEAARPRFDAVLTQEEWCRWWETIVRPALSVSEGGSDG